MFHFWYFRLPIPYIMYNWRENYIINNAKLWNYIKIVLQLYQDV